MKLFSWKDKSGKEVSWNEFKERYKQGINEVTPIQRLESSIFFQQIMTLGFFFGLCVSLYNYKTTWWLAIILFGGLGMNILQYKSLRQQLNIFKKIEEQFKESDELAMMDVVNRVGIEAVKGAVEDQEEFLGALKGEDENN